MKSQKVPTDPTPSTNPESSKEDQIITLLQSIDWKLWEMLKIVKPELDE